MELNSMKEGVSSDAVFIKDVMKNCQFVGNLWGDLNKHKYDISIFIYKYHTVDSLMTVAMQIILMILFIIRYKFILGQGVQKKTTHFELLRCVIIFHMD